MKTAEEFLAYLNNPVNWYPAFSQYKNNVTAQNYRYQSSNASCSSGDWSGPSDTTTNLRRKQTKTNDQLRPRFFQIDIPDSEDKTVTFELIQVLLKSMPLEHVLLLFIGNYIDATSQHYIVLIPDYEYYVSPEIIQYHMNLNQEIVMQMLNNDLLDWSISLLSEPEQNVILKQIKQFPYAGCFGGTVTFPDTGATAGKAKILKNLSMNSSFYLITMLRPLSEAQVQDLESRTAQLNDNLSTIVSRGRSVIRSRSSTCSSSATLAGSISNSSAKSYGKDRREILIDISNDEEADFWSDPYIKFTPGNEIPLENTAPTPAQSETNQNDTNQDETNQDDTNQNETNQDDTNQNESNPPFPPGPPGPPPDAITRSRNLSSGCNNMRSASASDSTTSSNSHTCTTTCSMSEVTFNATAKDWIQFVDMFPHQQYAMAYCKKIFLNNTIILSDAESPLHIISGCLSDILSHNCHYAPYKLAILSPKHPVIQSICQFRVPYLDLEHDSAANSCQCALSQFSFGTRQYSGNLMTGDEIAYLLTLFS